MTQSTLTTSYVFGHSEEEIQRLLRQSRLYNPCTRRLLEQAGIILPRQVEYRIVQAEEVDIDTWSERLRAEIIQQRLFIASGILVGAWTRVG